jgi:hypothetical protein
VVLLRDEDGDAVVALAREPDGDVHAEVLAGRVEVIAERLAPQSASSVIRKTPSLTVCSMSSMFAPCSNSSPVTAATMPVRSAPTTVTSV